MKLENLTEDEVLAALQGEITRAEHQMEIAGTRCDWDPVAEVEVPKRRRWELYVEYLKGQVAELTLLGLQNERH